MKTRGFPADWDKHGRAAGLIRNARMLSESDPRVVVAFSPDLNFSRGTADMVAKARKAEVRTILVRGEDDVEAARRELAEICAELKELTKPV